MGGDREDTMITRVNGCNVELYYGDCLSMALTADALITDPPYGMNAKVNYRSRKRGKLAECTDFDPIVGDDKPFDPYPWLGYETICLFGANWYAHKLPASGAWIVWDKLDGLKSKREVGFNDNSDCELAWTNKGKAARIIHHRWMGCMKASEHGQRRVHPTQKPIELMKKIVCYLTKPGDTVLDPYMGSGPTGIACVLTGRHFIGAEINPTYFDIATERILSYQRPSEK